MRQQLENSLYNARPVEKGIRVYQIGDLESLSASALYYGEGSGSSGFSSGGFGGISKKERDKYRIVETPLMKDSGNSRKIIIRPMSTFDLHIHPDSGAGRIKAHGEKHGYPLTNYKTAMADLYADLLKIPKIKK